uniref:Uncharacterized protein n=1 Tax=Glossina palpalis gambiensis TaxID=67801 RepID=A0A1B0B3P9_9MUSC
MQRELRGTTRASRTSENRVEGILQLLPPTRPLLLSRTPEKGRQHVTEKNTRNMIRITKVAIPELILNSINSQLHDIKLKKPNVVAISLLYVLLGVSAAVAAKERKAFFHNLS